MQSRVDRKTNTKVQPVGLIARVVVSGMGLMVMVVLSHLLG